MRRRPYRAFWVLLLLVGCGGEERKAPAPDGVDSAAPKLTASPQPGLFYRYSLDVTISSSDPDAMLFFDQDLAPDPKKSKGQLGSIKVHLTKSAQVHVVVAKEGKTWGPYVFEYRLADPVHGASGCSVAELSKYWYTGSDQIVVEADYQFPVSISRLILLVDGSEIPVEVPQQTPTGTQTANLGSFGAGVHTVACLIRSPSIADTEGNQIEFAVDSQPPVAAWLDPGGSFTRESWPGIFRLEASDSHSGLASVEVCDTLGFSCMPMLELGGGVYAYATVITSQTVATATVLSRVSDVAGNWMLVDVLPVDLSAFAEPPMPAVLPITLTTRTALHLPQELGRPVSEACPLDGGVACYPDVTNIPLEIGWNDLRFRAGSRLEWESFAIYRNGLAIELPPSSHQWLVFASDSTVPMSQSSLVAITSGVTTWQRAWFDIPHLFFVEDRDPDGAWGEYDALFTLPTDPGDGRWLAEQVPFTGTAVNLPLASAAATQTVTITCPMNCDGTGDVIFERRAGLYSYPLTHAILPGGFGVPQTISAEQNDQCIFYWDADLDGTLDRLEPRTAGICSSSFFELRRREGPFRWSPLGSLLEGLEYGGMVRRTLELLDSAGGVLAAYPQKPLADQGFGVMRNVLETTSGGPIPGVASRMVFSNGGEITAATYPAGFPPSLPFEYQAHVTDEDGAPVEALVQLRRNGSIVGVAASDSLGNATIGVLATEPVAEALAIRQGYLSFGIPTTSSSLELRVLSPSVTGTITGMVLDALGQPVADAALVWQSPPYESWTVSATDGSYSLPASGGAGLLTVSASGNYFRTESFSLSVTNENLSRTVTLPTDRADTWPMGAWGSFLPEVRGQGVEQVFYNDRYYAADVTSDRVEVVIQGIGREVNLPGALPAPDFHSNSPLDVTFAFARDLNVRAVCGARHQPIESSPVLIDSDCWSIVGDDGIQDYYFSRITVESSTIELFGVAALTAWFSEGSVVPQDQALLFQDQLLDRTIRLPLIDGVVTGYLPYGIYRIQTEAGTWLADEVVISEQYVTAELTSP